MEVEVLGDEAFGLGEPLHALEAGVEVGQAGLVDACRGQRGDPGLEDAAALEELGDALLPDQVEERPTGPDEALGVQVGDERAGSAAHLEHSGAGQGADGLAQR